MYEEPSAEIVKIANGWKLRLAWYESKEPDKDYKSEEWLFATWEEAIEKAKTFFESQKA